MLRFDLLYPTPDSGEGDFLELAARSDPPALVTPVYFPWPKWVDDLATLSTEDRYDAVRELGSVGHLRAVLPELLAVEGRPEATIFEVTSASFLHGERGVSEQITLLKRLTQTPVTSTTAAFKAALSHLGISRVSLASVYHPRASDHFIDRLAEGGVTTVGRCDDDAASDRELARWDEDRIVDLVIRSLSPEAQAVVIPETALHTQALGERLDAAAGRPVVTATQVSLWHAYQLAGVRPLATAAGVLFGQLPLVR